MHWTNIGLILVAIFDIGVAFFVWLRNWKNRINIYFGLNQLGLGLWAFSLAMFREAATLDAALFWQYAQSVTSSSSIVAFYLFAVFFPYQIRKVDFIEALFISITPGFFAIMALLPNFWLSNIFFNPHRNNFVVNKWGHSLFVGIFLLYSFFGVYILIKKYLRGDSFNRKRIGLLLYTLGGLVIFSALFGVVGSYILNGIDLVWIVPFAVLPLNFVSIYIILFLKP